MSKALYRKYRSKSLDEVIGQKHITDILSRAISVGRVSHAYLLTGPRGVGKTSVARILAHEINKLTYDEDITNLDIIEIDAASNNGVEDVRDLREKVQIAPVSASKKVYIIDEVHMLSKAAFNALLKTLEEPPEHVVFILATTNAEKLPATIISRTQRFSFRPISIDDAFKHLAYIAKQEDIKVTDDALKLIAQRSDGSFRDSISLLDQLSSLVDAVDNKTITTELIEDILGLAPSETIDQLLDAVESRNITQLVELLNRTFDEGVSSTVLVAQLTDNIRNQIADKPQLIPLLDALIDVTKSPQPQLKLLSVLGMAASPKQPPKSIALATPVREVSASIAELEKQAGLDQTADTGTNISISSERLRAGSDKGPGALSNSGCRCPDKTEMQLPAMHSSQYRTSRSNPLEPKSEVAPGPNSDLERSRIAEESEVVANKTEPNQETFDWNKLIDYTRQNHIALYSVLSKCNYQLTDNDLTLYTGNKFYKKKLDDTKYTSLLSECLQKIGVYELDIHTIPTAPPPKDSQAAAVAAIMGGGEEVLLEP
jgi:DNA polymerase-3 subunit gamma/tau